jgi:GntR family transcriptional regulator
MFGQLTTPVPLPDTQLDRRSFEPLYHQLHQLLARQIETGVWQPGDLLPSEPELCRRLAVSRMVVRQALARLEDEGHVTRRRGRGTFVSTPPLRHHAAGLLRTLSNPRREGVELEVLGRSNGYDAPAARHFGLPKKQLTCVTTLVRFHGRAVAVSCSYFEPECEWIGRLPVGRDIPRDFVLGGIRDWLSVPQVTVEAGCCSAATAEWLSVPERSPVFVTRITEPNGSAVAGSAPLERAHVELPSDRVECAVALPADGPNQIAVTFVESQTSRVV